MSRGKEKSEAAAVAEVSEDEIVAIAAFLLLSQHEAGPGGSIHWATRIEDKQRIAVRQRDPRKAIAGAFQSPKGSQ